MSTLNGEHFCEVISVNEEQRRIAQKGFSALRVHLILK